MAKTNGAVTDEMLHTKLGADLSSPLPCAEAIVGYTPATGDNCVSLVDL